MDTRNTISHIQLKTERYPKFKHKKNTMSEIIKKPQISSLPDIVRQSKNIPTIRRSDQKEVNNVVLDLVISVFNFYNEIPNDIQLRLIIPTVKAVSMSLTIPDLQIFKNFCLKGKYEKKFRLTGDVFVDWIQQYKAERMLEFENYNLSAKKQIESEPISEKTVEILKEIADKTKSKVEVVYPVSKQDSAEVIFSKKVESILSKKFGEIATEAVSGTIWNVGNSKIKIAWIDKRPYTEMEYIRLMMNKANQDLKNEPLDQDFRDKLITYLERL